MSEPFRLFFALGLAIGSLGVVLWPLYYWGVLSEYHGVMHSRLQIESFLGSFVIGFLATAIPRLLETMTSTRAEIAIWIILFIYRAPPETLMGCAKMQLGGWQGAKEENPPKWGFDD